tara:strand:+ start:2816 stop:3430 length:615 start_codon:yes stop_codon:yes gene_type:complete
MAKSKKNDVELEIVEDTQAAEEEADTNADINAAFSEAVNAEKDEDAVKMDMIQAGATFKNVTRLFNQYMIDAGLAISTADRKQIVDDTLEGMDLSTEEGFDAAVTALMDSVQGATDRSAAALVRSFGKKGELEVFAKPKTEGGNRNPFVSVFHAALIENPSMDEQGLKDVIAALEPTHQVNPNRWFSQHNNIRKTANAIAAKFA